MRPLRALLVAATLLSVLAPIALRLGGLWVPSFAIPFACLLALGVLRILGEGPRGPSRAVRAWGIWGSAVTLGVIVMAATTVTQAPSDFETGLLSVWAMGCLLGVWAAAQAGRDDLFRMLVYYALLGLFVEGTLGIVQVVTQSPIGEARSYVGDLGSRPDIVTSGVFRAIGTFSFPNTLAVWINMTIPLASVPMTSHERWPKWSRAAAVVVLPLGIVACTLTLSRGNLLALALVVTGSLVRPGFGGRRSSIRRYARIAMTVVSVAVGALVLATQLSTIGSIREALTSRLAMGSEAASFRGAMDALALRFGLESGLIGLGFGRGGTIWALMGAFESTWTYRPHNILLVLLVEGGGVVFLCFLFAFAYPLAAATRHGRLGRSESVYVLSACVGIGVVLSMGYLEVIDQDLWPLLMFLTGSLVAAVGRDGPTLDGQAG